MCMFGNRTSLFFVNSSMNCSSIRRLFSEIRYIHNISHPVGYINPVWQADDRATGHTHMAQIIITKVQCICEEHAQKSTCADCCCWIAAQHYADLIISYYPNNWFIYSCCMCACKREGVPYAFTFRTSRRLDYDLRYEAHQIPRRRSPVCGCWINVDSAASVGGVTVVGGGVTVNFVCECVCLCVYVVYGTSMM